MRKEKGRGKKDVFRANLFCALRSSDYVRKVHSQMFKSPYLTLIVDVELKI